MRPWPGAEWPESARSATSPSPLKFHGCQQFPPSLDSIAGRRARHGWGTGTEAGMPRATVGGWSAGKEGASSAAWGAHLEQGLVAWCSRGDGKGRQRSPWSGVAHLGNGERVPSSSSSGRLANREKAKALRSSAILVWHRWGSFTWKTRTATWDRQLSRRPWHASLLHLADGQRKLVCSMKSTWPLKTGYLELDQVPWTAWNVAP